MGRKAGGVKPAPQAAPKEEQKPVTQPEAQPPKPQEPQAPKVESAKQELPGMEAHKKFDKFKK